MNEAPIRRARGRPRNEESSVTVPVAFPSALMARVDRFAAEDFIKRRPVAIRVLVERGLKAVEQDQ
jgi:hypothetical protein